MRYGPDLKPIGPNLVLRRQVFFDVEINDGNWPYRMITAIQAAIQLGSTTFEIEIKKPDGLFKQNHETRTVMTPGGPMVNEDTYPHSRETRVVVSTWRAEEYNEHE